MLRRFFSHQRVSLPPPAPPSPPARSRWSPSAWLWLIVLLVAAAAVVRNDWIRAKRVAYVSNLTEWSVDDPMVDTASPTGYGGGLRRLIVPHHSNESYEWLAQTQQMFARREWRVRRVDYENAPNGREVHAPSPYRWWLGLVAWVDHASSQRPLGQSVERAAVWADPCLHLLVLFGASTLVASRFSGWAAAVVAIGIAWAFPFSANFVPGVPRSAGLSLSLALFANLLLLAGWEILVCSNPHLAANPEKSSFARGQKDFVLSGLLSGLALWVSVPQALPVLLGTVFGAFVAAVLARFAAPSSVAPLPALSPWRRWAWAGASISVVGYFVEYFPGQLSSRLEVNHPFYAIAWIGVGEVLAQLVPWIQRAKSRWTARDGFALGLGMLAVALLPFELHRRGTDLLAQEGPSAARLSVLHSANGPSVSTWWLHEGFSSITAATLLPLLLALGALVMLLLVRITRPERRPALGLALGLVGIISLQAFRQLAWWSLVDVALLGLVAAAFPAFVETKVGVIARWAGCAAAAGLFLLGWVPLHPGTTPADDEALTEAEGEAYIARDLAHWLAQQSRPSGALILASPELTTPLSFHGGLRGLGSANWENDQGNTATVRILSALSAEEASELINARGVTHLVIPSWDSSLDEFAALGLRAPIGSERFDQSFIGQLHRWEIPHWLRPIPYPLPPASGGERSVILFQVVEEQDPILAASRLAEYFLEMQQLDRAFDAAQSLRRFPGDVGALTAIAQVEAARGDAAAAGATVAKLLPLVSRTARRPIPFDRRVSLAVVLAQQKQSELAKDQVTRCLAEADETKLRFLTSVSLYRLELLGKLYGLHFSDPALQELAHSLLRPDLRARL